MPLGKFQGVKLMQWATPLIIKALKQAGVSRFVLMSAFGVGDTAKKASFLARLVYATMTRSIFQDKAISETLISTSEPDWTIAYSVNLNPPKAGKILPHQLVLLEQVSHVPGLPSLSFANPASALIELASRPDTIGKKFLIAPPKRWR